jgi:hypothetical protein
VPASSLSSAEVRPLWEEPTEEIGLKSDSVGILAACGGEDVKFLNSPSAKISSRMPLLEIAVQSLQTAIAAEHAGADRIELCSNLQVGGTTPGLELLQQTRAAIKIPIHVLIRPRPGNFFYTAREFAQMKNQIAAARSTNMNGVVLAILHKNSTIDVERTRELFHFAQPLNRTFHRAFDVSLNPIKSLEDVIATGADRNPHLRRRTHCSPRRFAARQAYRRGKSPHHHHARRRNPPGQSQTPLPRYSSRRIPRRAWLPHSL